LEVILPFESLQLGSALCGIAINHISFVLLLGDVLAILKTAIPTAVNDIPLTHFGGFLLLAT
jgi:hypothetical protein